MLVEQRPHHEMIREALVSESDRLNRPFVLTEIDAVTTQHPLAQHESEEGLRPSRVHRGECICECLSRLIGEVVAAGTPLATIGEVGRRWVRVYLPARLLAGLPAGTPAQVTVARAERGDRDAAGAPVEGRLGAVSSKAEFTPRAALTE